MPRKTNGTTIRVLREALGIDLATLAARTELSKASLSRIETGAQQPPPATARRIADGLGVPLEAISFHLPDPARVAS